jgi:outer membrane protein
VNKTTLALIALALLGTGAPARAGLLDELRKIDINDYAIGLGVSTSDSIYVGEGTSSWIYPYVTRFSPSDFDNGILFQRARGYGVRWLNDDWEAGAVARVQTLGFGANASAALDGLEDRGWTAEIGPTVGWRRWPVNVDWTALADLFSHHSGTNQVLRVSRPVLFEHGYVVPEIGFNYYGASYVDYYFGVPATASRADRPAYTASSAQGPSLAVGWGIRVKPNWLLTGKYSVERLGSGITDSPLVATNERRSFSLQFAYDGTLFDDLAEPTLAGGRAWEARLTLEIADVDADASIVPPSDEPGAPAGDFSANTSLARLDAAVLFAQRHRVDVGYSRALHTFSNAPVASELTVRDLQLAYGFDLIRDAQKEVTVLAGFHVSELSVRTASAAGRETDSTLPLPVLGVAGLARLTGKLSAHADLRWFLLDADRHSGNQVLARAALMHRTFDKIGLGIGYVFSRLSLDSDDGDLGGHITSSYRGPTFVLAGSF